MSLIWLTVFAVGALLALVLWIRLPAFLSLLIVSLVFGLLAGMTPADVISAVQSGMGGTLGFVAVVVGLGAMMGTLLEISGGVQSISQTLLSRFGPDRSSWALGLIGFLVAIPVFFDVALIILIPVLLGLQKKSGKPLILYALPLLAGLAVTHAFMPPTPGPIAVAEILGADLGWVILFGALAGLPAMLLAGPFLARYLARQTDFIEHIPPESFSETDEPARPLNFAAAMTVILLPLVLILLATLTKALASDLDNSGVQVILFIGHPFTALILTCLYAWAAFGLGGGIPKKQLHDAMVKALEPAGLVVLVTGAGGVFKQILVDSGGGAQLADALSTTALPLVAFAFIVAGIVRVAQGSATVAMITAAGLTAPVAATAGVEGAALGLLVIAIASGASLTSHVNDSGFWLVSRYLNLTEAQTLKSWTVATTIIGFTGFAVVAILSLFI